MARKTEMRRTQPMAIEGSLRDCATREEDREMPRITVGTENDAPIEIHYQDHGSGGPVVMVHGYPLNGTRPLAQSAGVHRRIHRRQRHLSGVCAGKCARVRSSVSNFHDDAGQPGMSFTMTTPRGGTTGSQYREVSECSTARSSRRESGRASTRSTTIAGTT